MLASALIATGSLGVLTACTSDQPKTAVEKPVSLTIDAPKITVLNPGTGPLKQVTFSDSGASQTARIALQDGFDQGTGRADSLATAPESNPNLDTLTATLDTKVSSNSPRDVTYTLQDPRHSSAARSSEVASIAGFELGTITQTSGRVDSVRLAAPANASDGGRALAELYLMKFLAQPVVFPSDPIGVGATWTVDNRITGDSTMLRTTTYTLSSLDGTVATIEAKISDRPAIGALSLAEQGGTGELKVLSTESHGGGTLTVDLTKPVPTAGKLSVTTRVIYGEDGTDTRVFQDFASGMEYS